MGAPLNDCLRVLAPLDTGERGRVLAELVRTYGLPAGTTLRLGGGARLVSRTNSGIACAKFELVIDAIRDAARRVGYAIAVHGSLARDIDLVAVPWVEGADDAETLAAVVMAAAAAANDGIAYLFNGCPEDELLVPADRHCTLKPHGRKAWSIHLGGTYLDLSVIPRAS